MNTSCYQIDMLRIYSDIYRIPRPDSYKKLPPYFNHNLHNIVLTVFKDFNQKVFIMYYANNCTIDEIAQEVNATVEDVQKSIDDTLNILRGPMFTDILYKGYLRDIHNIILDGPIQKHGKYIGDALISNLPLSKILYDYLVSLKLYTIQMVVDKIHANSAYGSWDIDISMLDELIDIINKYTIFTVGGSLSDNKLQSLDEFLSNTSIEDYVPEELDDDTNIADDGEIIEEYDNDNLPRILNELYNRELQYYDYPPIYTGLTIPDECKHCFYCKYFNRDEPIKSYDINIKGICSKYNRKILLPGSTNSCGMFKPNFIKLSHFAVECLGNRLNESK